MILTYTERKAAMTQFAKDSTLDVQTIRRTDGSLITLTRSNQILNWKKGE